MEAASCGKRSLSVEQPLRQRCDDRLGDEQAALDARRVDPNRLDGALAADSARRRCIEVSADALRVESSGLHVDRVGREIVGNAGGDRLEPFGQAEPEGELLVVAGGSHRDGDGLTADPDLERLLDGENLVTFDTRRQPQGPHARGRVGRRLRRDFTRHVAQRTRETRANQSGPEGQLATAQIAYTVSDQLGMNASVSVALAR